MPVQVIHWNPQRPRFRGRVGGRLPLKTATNNFGDLIGPLLVDRMLAEHRVTAAEQAAAHGRLLSVGSILHFAQPGDVVWGSGINGKKTQVQVDASRLDIRSVRGPLTRQELLGTTSHVPAVFGDPALLWGVFWPRDTYQDRRLRRAVSVVPNLHDFEGLKGDPRSVNPRGAVHDVVRQIANSDFVCGSSLHGVIIAEALGIPARLIRPSVEPPFKYDDYYRGTGREQHTPAGDVKEAIMLGGEDPPTWEPEGLLSAFPIDLWRRN